jgi:CheY-like chemotaxis protein
MPGSEFPVTEILLVEDDPEDALVIRESFESARSGVRFHAVTGGDRALAFLRREGDYATAPEPALILLDLSLAGAHGLQFLAQVKTDPELRVIPVIVLSSSQRPSDIRRAYGLHANAYIVKPHDYEGYAAVVKQIDACFLGLIQAP